MAARASTNPFVRVKRIGLALPGVEATKRHWAGGESLTTHGRFVASLAAHESAEPNTLVVRCDPDSRELLLQDAPDTYYVTDYYAPHPVVLARLSELTDDAIRDLLTVSLRLSAKGATGAKGATRAKGTYCTS